MKATTTAADGCSGGSCWQHQSHPVASANVTTWHVQKVTQLPQGKVASAMPAHYSQQCNLRQLLHQLTAVKPSLSCIAITSRSAAAVQPMPLWLCSEGDLAPGARIPLSLQEPCSPRLALKPTTKGEPQGFEPATSTCLGAGTCRCRRRGCWRCAVGLFKEAAAAAPVEPGGPGYHLQGLDAGGTRAHGLVEVIDPHLQQQQQQRQRQQQQQQQQLQGR
jgi:hypothetical protein